MSGINAFCPGLTVNLAVTSVSARVALLPNTSYYKGGTVRIVNNGSREAFIKFGDSTVVATANDLSLLTAASETFTIPPSCTHIAAICTTTTNLNITLGQGI